MLLCVFADAARARACDGIPVVVIIIGDGAALLPGACFWKRAPKQVV